MKLATTVEWLVVGVGLALGVLYGLVSYALLDQAGGVMILSFLVLVPFALGAFAGFVTRREEGFLRAVLRSVLIVVLFALGSLVLGWEGLLCLVFGLPVLIGGGVLGAAVVFLVRGAVGRSGAVVLSLALPFLMAPIERGRDAKDLYRTTSNSIVVRATPETVWAHVRSVDPIGRAEFRGSWSHAIGLPKPVAAVLDRDGVGGVRVATFEDGLSFHETVTEWEPGRRLAFRIEARDPGRLDPHVRVGGQYFDVVSGRYDIESLGDGLVVVHLTSTQRVTTHLNPYVAFWVNAMMSDLQQSILRVVRLRSESRSEL